MKEYHQIIKRPLITEKTNTQKDASNQLAFEVEMRANKIEIMNAIKHLFNVTPVEVQTMIVPGKTKRVGRNFGKRKNWKKAIVKLKAGETIDFFEGV